MRTFWTMILVISLKLDTGFASSNSDITIGVMVDLQYGFEMLLEDVDKVINECRGEISRHRHHLEVKWALLKSTNITDITSRVCGMIHQGVQAVITVLGFTQRKMVSGMIETFQIPHLSVDLDLSYPAEYMYTLHLTSPYKTISRALVDIAHAADWKQIGLSFNKIIDYRTRQQFVLQLSLAGIPTVLRTSADTNITDGRIVLMVEGEAVNSKQVSIQNEDTLLMLTKTVFVQKLTPEIARGVQITNKHTNILAVQIDSPSRCSRSNMGSNKSIKFLEDQVADAVLMLYDILKGLPAHSWAVCLPHHQHAFAGGNQIMKLLTAACDVGEWNICHQLNKPVEYNLYFIPVGSDRDPIPLGQWTENTGLSITTTHPDITNRLFSHKLTDFGGITLRVVVDGTYRPFSFPGDSGNGSYVGMMIDIMDDLADKLNFRYTVTESPGNEFGTKTSDGNFTGMVGMVARGEADIGAAPFTVTTERNEVVDFTTGFMQDSLGILTPKVTKARNLFQVFKPFALETWLTILAVFLFTCVVFVFISLTSPRQTTDNTNPHAILERSVWENVFLIISSYFEQGPTFHPTSGSSRCFLAFWMVFSLLNITIYTAHLAAALTVTTPVKPIDTLQDLVEQTDLEILSEEGSSISRLFNKSKQPLYMEIASRMQTSPTSVSRVEMVRKGKSCYITDRSYLEYVAVQSCGELRLASERFYGFPLAFIIPKNSPYKPAIDISIQKMVESGLIGELLQKWMTPRTDCPRTENIQIRQLGLDALGGLFIVYLTVTLVSIIILFIQLLYNQYLSFLYKLN